MVCHIDAGHMYAVFDTHIDATIVTGHCDRSEMEQD